MYARKEENKVKIYSKLPEVFKKENGQTKPNFRNASQEVYNEEGFYDIENPDYDSKTQKLGDVEIFEDEKIARYKIIDKSTKEKEDEEDRDEDNKQNEKKNLGSDLYTKTKRRLVRKLRKGKLTENQFNKLYTPIRKAMIWCNSGDFDIALEEMQKLSYSNQKLKDIVIDIISKLEENNTSLKRNK